MKTSVLITFDLADPAGILYFSNIFTLAHQAYEKWVVEHLKFPWKYWFQNPEWSVPLKKAEAEYFRPLQAGETYEVGLFLREKKSTSFVLEYHFTKDTHLCCKVNTVHVFCDKNFNKIQIPEKFFLETLSSAQ